MVLLVNTRFKMKKIILAIFRIVAILVVLFALLFWYIGINAIPLGGE